MKFRLPPALLWIALLAPVLLLLLLALGMRAPQLTTEAAPPAKASDSLTPWVEAVYAHLKQSTTAEPPAFPVFEKAFKAYLGRMQSGQLHKPLLSIIDFSLPSSQERLWVFDLQAGRLLHHSLVAHGQKTGELYAERFSNTPSSHQSSLGFYSTGSTYQGKHGLSLYLHGLDVGLNDKAHERAIVMHAADYVSHSFVAAHGRLGRSHGCPAIPTELKEILLPLLAGGSLLYIHHPSEQQFRFTRTQWDDAQLLQACRDYCKQLGMSADFNLSPIFDKAG